MTEKCSKTPGFPVSPGFPGLQKYKKKKHPCPQSGALKKKHPCPRSGALKKKHPCPCSGALKQNKGKGEENDGIKRGLQGPV